METKNDKNLFLIHHLTPNIIVYNYLLTNTYNLITNIIYTLIFL